MDTLAAMRAFALVAQEGAFVAAAERLRCSPQQVSKQVGQLEEKLGVRLFQRTTRSVSLTELGHSYFLRCRPLLEELDALEDSVSQAAELARGTLRLAAPMSFGIRHLAPALAAFQRDYPEVAMDIDLNDRKVDVVEEGFDVALRIGHLDDSSLVARRITTVKRVMVASPEYVKEKGEPRSPQDLKTHSVLQYRYGQDFEGSKNFERIAMTANNGDLLVAAAVDGAGIAIQPTFIAGDALRGGELVALSSLSSPSSLALYAVFAHRHYVPGKVRRFIEFISKYFGDPPYWDKNLKR